MYRYQPPKSNIWGHRLRNMPAATAKQRFAAFLTAAVAEYRFANASLVMTSSDSVLLKRFEQRLGVAALNTRIPSPALTHAAALLVVHGRITVTTLDPSMRIDIHARMGCVFDPGEAYSIESATGVIVSIVESESLAGHERGISSPERIAGARWPSNSVTFGA